MTAATSSFVPMREADQGSRALSSPVGVVLAAALLTGLAHRLLVGWSAPLWLDETFSGAIAIQPTFDGLVQWCLTELSGPVYYSVLWAWEKIAGPSNFALRVPSLIFSIAAPLLLLWKGHPDRTTRCIWAGLAAVWLPGLMFATEARPYALLFLLASAQSIAFLRMLRQPGMPTALLWSSMSALLILTHYHTLVISGLQGLIYLIVGRKEAWRSWPAALIFVPVAAWMAVHLPFLMQFASPDVVWYNRLGISAIGAVPRMLLGVGLPATCLLLLIGATWSRQGWQAVTRRAAFPYSTPDMMLVASGVLAFLVVFVAAFLRPSFSPRYLLPYMPAILFGIAIWARSLEPRLPRAGTFLLAGFTGVAVAQMIVLVKNPRLDHRYSFNFEQPSAWFASQGIERVLFLWDNPTRAITTSDHLTQVGGFFFKREGRSPAILPPTFAGGIDPNPALIATAEKGKAAILWAYDIDVPGTMGIQYPARISGIDARWTCRDFGRDRIHVVACIR